MSLLCLLGLLICTLEFGNSSQLDEQLSGPGLSPQRHRLPCQYFHVHGVPTAQKISVRIQAQRDKRPFTVPTKVFRSTKDSLLVQYKPPSFSDSLTISVTSDGKDVSGSPIFINEEIVSSSCNCPEKKVDFEDWLRDSCRNDLDPQIVRDFQFFEGGPQWNISQFLGILRRRFSNPRSQSYCHYVIKDNELYRECFGEHVGFNMFVDGILHYLTRIMNLPDVEFIINLGDWPLVHKVVSPGVPIISWCKTQETSDILWPTYDITQASLECMGRQEVDVFSVREKSAGVPWEEKVEKGFWRGRDSNLDRLKLVQISKENPQILDAGITRYFFFRDREKDLGSKNSTSFFDFYKYKYLLTLDGTVAAYRLPYLLSGNSAVFKQDSDYYEHFYHRLRPYTHYIPLHKDLSNLKDTFNWAKDHDETLKNISENARILVNKSLLPDKVFCYHAQVLKEWKKRLSGDGVELHPGLRHVPQPQAGQIYCVEACQCKSKKDEGKEDL